MIKTAEGVANQDNTTDGNKERSEGNSPDDKNNSNERIAKKSSPIRSDNYLYKKMLDNFTKDVEQKEKETFEKALAERKSQQPPISLEELKQH